MSDSKCDVVECDLYKSNIWSHKWYCMSHGVDFSDQNDPPIYCPAGEIEEKYEKLREDYDTARAAALELDRAFHSGDTPDEEACDLIDRWKSERSSSNV